MPPQAYIPSMQMRLKCSASDSDTRHPALVTVVLQPAEIRTEQLEIQIQIAEVVQPADQMRAEKVSVEPLAQPVTHLRLDRQLFPFAVVRESPGIPVSRNVERPLRSQRKLRAEVQGRRGIVQQVGFDCDFLGTRGRADSGEQQQQ